MCARIHNDRCLECVPTESSCDLLEFLQNSVLFLALTYTLAVSLTLSKQPLLVEKQATTIPKLPNLDDDDEGIMLATALKGVGQHVGSLTVNNLHELVRHYFDVIMGVY